MFSVAIENKLNARRGNLFSSDFPSGLENHSSQLTKLICNMHLKGSDC